MLSFERIHQIEEAVAYWNEKNRENVTRSIEYPVSTDGYLLHPLTPDEDPELLARAAKDMGISEKELEEFLRQVDILVDEHLLAETHDISEEDLRESESIERESWGES